MRMHASSVLVAMSVYVMQPPPPRRKLIICLCCTYSTSPGWNHLCSSLICSRLEHLD